MIATGNYTIGDIKDIIIDSLPSNLSFGLGYLFKNKGNVYEFVGVDDSVILYDMKTFEPVRKFGIYYRFKIIDTAGDKRTIGLHHRFEHGNINPSEWERLK